MLVKKNNFYSAFIWFFIAIIQYVIFNALTYSEDSLKILAIVVIINCLAQIVTLKMMNYPLISFFCAFIVFLYVFHFGQVITAAYFPTSYFDVGNYITHYMTNRALAWQSLCVCLLSINLIYCGGLIKSEYDCEKNVCCYEDDRSYLTCYRMGRFLFAIGLPFRLFIDIRQLAAALVGGYSAANALQSFSGVFGAIAGFWYISIPLIYLTMENGKKKKIFLIACLSYICLTMLTGNRGHQMVNIVAILIIVRHASSRSFRIREVIKWGIVGFVALIALDLVFEMRQYGINYFFQNFSVVLSDSLKNNVIIETLHNFGSTVFTPYLVLEGYGTKYNTFWGETYIKSFVSVIPDVTGAFRSINNSAIFARVLDTNHAIGGSFIGELYYNFGPLYGVFSLIFGVIFGEISAILYRAVKENDLYQVCKYLPFASLSLWWVRDSVGGVTRSVVWLTLLLLLFRSKRMGSVRNE